MRFLLLGDLEGTTGALVSSTSSSSSSTSGCWNPCTGWLPCFFRCFWLATGGIGDRPPDRSPPMLGGAAGLLGAAFSFLFFCFWALLDLFEVSEMKIPKLIKFRDIKKPNIYKYLKNVAISMMVTSFPSVLKNISEFQTK